MKPKPITITFDCSGVNIIDTTGEHLIGITETDAIQLFAALKKNMKKIKKREKEMQ